MKYSIDGIELKVVIERKKIKNTYLRVLEDYTLLITTNHLVSTKQINNFINSSEDAIRKMVKRVMRHNDKNSQFFFLGEAYDIIFLENIFNINRISHKIYTPSLKILEKELKKEMCKIFKERLDYCFGMVRNVPYPKLKIRTMKTRWGVCNRKDMSITLNSELIKKTIGEIDYVIYHELCHFIHFDHSALFWSEVSKYCPFYKEIRKKLKD